MMQISEISGITLTENKRNGIRIWYADTHRYLFVVPTKVYLTKVIYFMSLLGMY